MGTAAQCHRPWGLVCDMPSGNIFFVDNQVRERVGRRSRRRKRGRAQKKRRFGEWVKLGDWPHSYFVSIYPPFCLVLFVCYLSSESPHSAAVAFWWGHHLRRIRELGYDNEREGRFMHETRPYDHRGGISHERQTRTGTRRERIMMKLRETKKEASARLIQIPLVRMRLMKNLEPWRTEYTGHKETVTGKDVSAEVPNSPLFSAIFDSFEYSMDLDETAQNSSVKQTVTGKDVSSALPIPPLLSVCLMVLQTKPLLFVTICIVPRGCGVFGSQKQHNTPDKDADGQGCAVCASKLSHVFSLWWIWMRWGSPFSCQFGHHWRRARGWVQLRCHCCAIRDAESYGSMAMTGQRCAVLASCEHRPSGSQYDILVNRSSLNQSACFPLLSNSVLCPFSSLSFSTRR